LYVGCYTPGTNANMKIFLK